MKTLINLNSLTDIVSNSIGMVLLFALMTLFNLQGKTYEVEVPMAHNTELTPAFFLASKDAVLVLDEDVLFDRALEILKTSNGADLDVVYDLRWRGLQFYVNYSYGFVMLPTNTESWQPASTLSDPNGEFLRMLAKLDPKKYFVYFFVDDNQDTNGFAAFKTARDLAKRRGFRIGWQPYNKDHPPIICWWSDEPACWFKPYY